MEEEYGFNHQAMMDIPTSVTQEEIDENVRNMHAQNQENEHHE